MLSYESPEVALWIKGSIEIDPEHEIATRSAISRDAAWQALNQDLQAEFEKSHLIVEEQLAK